MPTTTPNGIVIPADGSEPADLFGVATRLGLSVEAYIATYVLPLLTTKSTRWTRSTTQSLTGGVSTVITYTATDGSAAAGAGFTESAGTITVANAGLYRVDGFIEFAANAAGYRRLSLDQNGSLYVGQAVLAAPVTGVTRLAASAIMNLAASDTVRMSGNQDSGGALNVSAANLRITRIGPIAA